VIPKAQITHWAAGAPTALRYSEDLDHVRTTEGPVGPVVDALRELTSAIGLEERSRMIRSGMATYVCRAPAEDGGTIRIKIETNVERSNRSTTASAGATP